MAVPGRAAQLGRRYDSPRIAARRPVLRRQPDRSAMGADRRALPDGAARRQAGRSPDVMTVLIGATHLAEGTRHKAGADFVNPGYSPMTFDNDLGLIKLEGGAAEPTSRSRRTARPTTATRPSSAGA